MAFNTLGEWAIASVAGTSPFLPHGPIVISYSQLLSIPLYQPQNTLRNYDVVCTVPPLQIWLSTTHVELSH